MEKNASFHGNTMADGMIDVLILVLVVDIGAEHDYDPVALTEAGDIVKKTANHVSKCKLLDLSENRKFFQYSKPKLCHHRVNKRF